MFRPKHKSVSIEMGENFIKIAETEVSKGRDVIVRLVRKEVHSKDDAGIAEEIKKIFSSLDISHRSVRLNIPRHLVTVRFLRLPSSDEEEIGKIIKIESLKHIPYTEEDAISGYRIIEKFQDGYSNVLLVIAQAGMVNKLTGILAGAGLGVEFISVGSEMLLLRYLAAREADQKWRAMVVNIDTDHIDIDVVDDDRLVFTRGVLYGTSQPFSTAKAIDQIRVSIMTYQKESNNLVDKVMVSGIPSKVIECRDTLAGELKIPVEAMDEMKNVPVGEKAEIDSADTSFIEILGLSLNRNSAMINLMPLTISEDNRLRALKNNFIISAVLAALIIAMSLGMALKKMHDKSVYLLRVNSELAKISPQVTKAKKIMVDMDIIKRRSEARPLAIDIVNEVYKITPQNISLNMLSFEKGQTLSVRGNVTALNEVFKYVTILESSAYFENVKVKYATKRAVANQEMADFEIECAIAKI